MNSLAFQRTSKAIAWVMTVAVVTAFSFIPQAFAFESRGNTSSAKHVSQLPNDGAVNGATVVNANAGDVLNFSLTIQNTSPTDVFYSAADLTDEAAPYVGAHELRVGATNDEVFSFIDFNYGGPFVNNNRFATFESGSPVFPGQNLTFNWSLKLKSDLGPGTYKYAVGVVQEYDAWLGDAPGPGAGGPNNNLGGMGGGTIFWNIQVGGGSTPVASGNVNVSLASGTPPSASIADGANANFTKVAFTTGSAPATLNQLYVTRDGLSLNSDVENVKLVGMDGTPWNSPASFNTDNRALLYFSPAITLPANSTTEAYIRAGIVDGTSAGKTVRLGIASASDVSIAGTVGGSLPVWGNAMTVVTLEIGTATWDADGTTVDDTPDAGDEDVVVNRFKVSAGSVEAITVESITVDRAGSASSADTKNIELWSVTENKSLGTVTTWSGDKATFTNLNLNVDKGGTYRFLVRLDIVSGSGQTVNVDLVDGTDVLANVKGQTYGFYITGSSGSWTDPAGGSDEGKGSSNQTINSGSLTISKAANTAPTGNIAAADNQALATFNFEARGESVRVTALELDFTVNGSTDLDASADTSGGLEIAEVTNVRLYDENGNIVAGPKDVASNSHVAFTDTFIIPVGTHGYTVRVRVASTAGAETVAVEVNAAADVTARGFVTNDTITAGGSFSVTGNTQTVKVGDLDIDTIGNPADSNVIVNTNDYVWSTFSFDAGDSGEDVLVSTVTVTDTLDGTTADMADIDNAELWADLDDNGTYETLVAGPDQPTGGGGVSDTHAFTLSTTIVVPKGGSIQVAFVGDLASGATANGTHKISVSAATATGADTGSDISESTSGAGGIMTVSASGEVTATIDSSSPASQILIAGTSGNLVGAWKLTATDEAFTLDNLEFDITSGGEDSIKSLTLTYPTQNGTATKTAAVSGTTVNFQNLQGYLAKDDSSVVTLKATFFKINSGGEPADFADEITITMEDTNGSNVKATGISSGTTDLDFNTSGSVSDGAGPAAAEHILYKTNLTVTQDTTGLSNVITPGGTQDLYRFKVTADSVGNGVAGGGGVAIKAFKFSITITDNGTTSATNTLGAFQFFRGTTELSASSAQISDITSSSPVTVESTNTITDGTSTIQVAFDDTPVNGGEELIGAGVTNTYTLRASAGAGFATDDAVSVVLLGDTTDPTDDATYLSDADSTATLIEEVIALQKADGTQDTSDVEFIWSDLSATSHASAFDADGVVEESSADWTNGYLIKNFPLSSFGMSV